MQLAAFREKGVIGLSGTAPMFRNCYYFKTLLITLLVFAQYMPHCVCRANSQRAWGVTETTRCAGCSCDSNEPRDDKEESQNERCPRPKQTCPFCGANYVTPARLLAPRAECTFAFSLPSEKASAEASCSPRATAPRFGLVAAAVWRPLRI